MVIGIENNNSEIGIGTYLYCIKSHIFLFTYGNTYKVLYIDRGGRGFIVETNTLLPSYIDNDFFKKYFVKKE